MITTNTYRIFLASSAELAEDRAAFAEMLRRRNDDWVGRGVHLRLILWEDFIDAMSQTRLQAEYNKAIQGCDIFVMLFFTKVGMYTAEEFDTAFKQFQATRKPFIYTYFRSAKVDLDAIDPGDLASRKAFQERLKALGHFQTHYPNVEALQLHFWQQLDKLVAGGFVTFPTDGDLGTGDHYQTSNTGSGAIAQGAGAQAYGAGAAVVHGTAVGNINTGTVTATGTVIQPPRTRKRQ